MGAILKTSKFTTTAEAVFVALILALVLGGIYWFAPGLRVSMSKTLNGLEMSKDRIDNVTKGVMVPIPSETPSTKVSSVPLVRIAEYGWNCNSGMIAANGGPRTTKGSLMEATGVNLEIVKLDGVGDLRRMQVTFVEKLSGGNPNPSEEGLANPSSEGTAFAVSIMGDGVPFYIATLQQELDDKFGKGKYHAQAIAAIGMSDGEDKLIGPKEWKTNPQLMKGALISSVIGDGDWVIAVNFAFANKIRVNPDPTTYDPEAVNFIPSNKDDYIESVKELIASQLTKITYPLKEVKDGKLTGKTVNIQLTGATTWTPGDKIAFDALAELGFSDIVTTKDFPNQMATTIVVIKEWAVQNEKIVTSILKNTYIVCNQLKQYDEWAKFASVAVCKTYNFETPKYWYDLFKGMKGNKGGTDYTIGGSRVLTYADAMQYYGITDGTNRYKVVYEQIGKYLVDLNPCGFNEAVKGGVKPYDEAVNLYFLKSINDIDAGTVKAQDYSQTKTTLLAKGQWHINFATNSTAISGSTEDLETIYSLLITAESTKVSIIGYTDSDGDNEANVVLSKGRALSVQDYLINKGIPRNRFQTVDGYGESDPVDTNDTAAGKAKNRRCEITLLK